MLAWAGVAAAEPGSIEAALKGVNTFESEEDALLGEFAANAGIDALRKSSAEESEEALAEIRSIKWSERPSKRRFARLYQIVDGYTLGRLEGLKEITVGSDEEGRLKSAVRRLSDLRKSSLLELKKSSAWELRKGDGKNIIPAIDRSPFDERPGESKGIWDR